MILNKLTLTTFRNYLAKTIDFSSGTTVLLGPNAAGKTNILEAVYLLATGMSFRAQKIEEMVHWEAEVGHVVGEVAGYPSAAKTLTASLLAQVHDLKKPLTRRDDTLDLKSVSSVSSSDTETNELQVTLTRGMVQGKRVAKRRLIVNGVPRRQVDFVGNLKAVVFLPQDLELISGSPAKRRNYLDQVLLQVDSEYSRALFAYENALKRRNKLLDAIREGNAPHASLAFWDMSLLKNGMLLTQKREVYIEAINEQARAQNAWQEMLQLTYLPSRLSPERLSKYAQTELAAGHTLIGPHKDDIALIKQESLQVNRDLATFGSRGEQRMGVLWLKLQQLTYMKHVLGESPLLLLDDIFSELDQDHDELVKKTLSSQQTIVTATNTFEASIDNAQFITLE
jgi:DNA replication and repair protein RecF